MLYKEAPRPSGELPNPKHWNKIKDEVLERDKRCRTCASDENLETHHITYERFGEELLEDLTVLCRPCRQAITASIRARREKYEPQDIHEEVVGKGSTLEAITDVLQRHDDILAEVHLFLESKRSKERNIRKNLSDAISDKICTIIETATCDCTTHYIASFLKGEAAKSAVQRRINILVSQGVLKMKPQVTAKRGRPALVYTIAK